MEGAINSLASVKESVSSDLEHMKEIYRVFFFFLVYCISNFSYTDVLTFLHKQQSMIVEGK